ncbi:hypothetical protein [Streptomyces sp. NPDC019224]|uniref:hypothetical protein n=1 Tax=Streptomyces sp. NPDC019224 TaxID=3154484 RepID=UPI0033E00781
MRCHRCDRALTEETATRYPIEGASGPARIVVLCKTPCRRSPSHPPSYPTR